MSQETPLIKDADPPVTVEIVRCVKSGHEAEFEDLISTISKEAKKFPGHLGTNIFKPSHGHHEYRVIYKFDCMSHFHAWNTAKIRRDYYAKIRPLLVEDPRMQILTGLETWFALPGEGIVATPPRYKIALLSWLAIYPLVILILECLNPILSTLPIPARAAIITLIAIPTMTYILMPNITKRFSRWLYPKVPEKISATA